MVEKPAKTWKERLLHEFKEYLVNFFYMSLFFSAIILFRRQILAEHGIHLDDYFMGVLKALVIAKVIMLGAFLGISRMFENKPLIFPVLYKTLYFTLWIMLFDLLEAGVRHLLQTGGFTNMEASILHHFSPVWFSALFLIFLSFIPFFAYKEMVRVEGKEKMGKLFFGNRSKI